MKQKLLNMFSFKLSKKNSAFSLVELMITISVISILFVVLITRASFADVKAKEAGVKNDFRAYSIAAEQVLIENSGIDGFENMAHLTSAMNGYLDEDLKFDITGTSEMVDPWKHEYKITLENVDTLGGEIVVTCAGKNALIDGIDDYYLSALYSAGDVAIATSGFSLNISDRSITSTAIDNDDIFTWNKSTITGFKEGVTNEQKAYITIPKHCTVIGGSAFKDETAIKIVKIEKGCTSINPYAFDGCSNLTNIAIPDTVTYIGHTSFANCTSLLDVALPQSITFLGNKAFNNCTSLVNMKVPPQITEIPNGLFQNCSNLEKVVLPENCTTIQAYAFCYCKKLKSVNVPDSVQSIGMSAFYMCNVVKNINIPEGITKIEDATFFNCNELNVKIPDSVISIGNNAFHGCDKMVIPYLPPNLEYIGNTAFHCCYYTFIDDLYLPDTMVSVGTAPFSFCLSIKEISAPDTLQAYESDLMINNRLETQNWITITWR